MAKVKVQLEITARGVVDLYLDEDQIQELFNLDFFPVEANALLDSLEFVIDDVTLTKPKF